MIARVITLDTAEATLASHRAVNNPFPLDVFPATTPEQAGPLLASLGLEWTYPWALESVCPVSGLRLHPYRTRDRAARIACFLSHYRLWHLAVESDEPVLVLEDDALFLRRFDPAEIPDGWGAVSLNDPRGATRLAGLYHAAVQAAPAPVAPVPWIDDRTVPQGLPGASAYLIRPECAQQAIGAAIAFGAWPNDALLCRQFFSDLGCLTDYATRVSGRGSTLA